MKTMLYFYLLFYFFSLQILQAQGIKADTLLARSYLEKAEELKNNKLFDSAGVFFEKAAHYYKIHQLKEKYLDCLNRKALSIINNTNNPDFEGIKTISETVIQESQKWFGKDNHFLSDAYFAQAVGDFHAGDYDQSLVLLEKTLRLCQKKYGETSIRVLECYHHLGNCYFFKGFYTPALENFRKSLSIALNLYPDQKNIVVAQRYNQIGNIYAIQENYDQALEYYRKGLQAVINLFGDVYHPTLVSNYMNIGNVLMFQYKFIPATQNYQKALQIAEKNQNIPYIALVYHNWGNLYLGKKQADSAIYFSQKALSIRKELYGEKHPYLGDTYYNIGEAYFMQNKMDSALANYQISAQIYHQIFGDKHTELTGIYNKIGETHGTKQNYQAALEAIQKGILCSVPDFSETQYVHNPKLNFQKPNYLGGLYLLDALYLKAKFLSFYFNQPSNQNQASWKLVFNTFHLADSLAENIRKGIDKESDRIALNNKITKIYQTAISACNQISPSNLLFSKSTIPDSILHLTFYFAERKKAQVLAYSIRESQAKQFAGIPDSLLTQERDLKIDISFYEQRLADKPDSTREAYFRDKLFVANRKYELLVDKLEQEFPKYYQLKYQNQVITVPEIQARLKPEEALLEYAFGDKHLFIFVLCQDTFVMRAVQMDSSFQSLVQNYLRSIKRNDEADFLKYSPQLYRFLIEPIADLIKGKKHLRLIPEESLNTIPFEALIAKNTATKTPIDFSSLPYLIRDFVVSYYPSATLAFEQNIEKKTKPEYDFLGFAPVFTDSRSTSEILEVNRSISTQRKFEPLPFSEEEIKKTFTLMQKTGKNGKICLHKEAEEKTLKAEIARYRFVHLATHSFANPDNLYLSFIALNQPDSLAFAQSLREEKYEAEDGILYVGEVYNLNLNTELLVLSACETGVGKLARGEGILSLLRGFTYAGARRIIYSLWKLSDRKTADILVDFYTQVLENGLTYSQALRQAKLNLLKNKTFAFPRWWAGLVLTRN